MGLVSTKPVFGVSGKARLKPVSLATETSLARKLKFRLKRVEILYFPVSEKQMR